VGEFVEGDPEPFVRRMVAAQLVVAAARVLHERGPDRDGLQ
jgi:hypothetical protein